MPVIPSTTQVVSPQISAKKLIKRALRLIGATRDPSPTELEDGLEAYNAMVDSWNTEKLTTTWVLRWAFSMVASQDGHTIGIGGDFDAPIPSRIDGVGIIPSGQTSEVELRYLTDAEYAAIPDKTTTGTPSSVWFDGKETFYFYPVPNAAHTFVLYDDSQFSQISWAEINASFTAPTGFKRAADYNLAVELASEWGVALADIADVVQTANVAKANMKRRNIKPVNMRCDSALAPRSGSGYDFRTNTDY